MSLSLLRQRLPVTLTQPLRRNFTMSSIRPAEGDAGAPRSGGASQSDAFTKREQASEDYYVKQEERKKLEELRKRIADKEADLAKDRQEAEKITGKK